jgi:hypothetical protein
MLYSVIESKIRQPGQPPGRSGYCARSDMVSEVGQVLCAGDMQAVAEIVPEARAISPKAKTVKRLQSLLLRICRVALQSRKA